jgi:hypothetical protein
VFEYENPTPAGDSRNKTFAAGKENQLFVTLIYTSDESSNKLTLIYKS